MDFTQGYTSGNLSYTERFPDEHEELEGVSGRTLTIIGLVAIVGLVILFVIVFVCRQQKESIELPPNSRNRGILPPIPFPTTPVYDEDHRGYDEIDEENIILEIQDTTLNSNTIDENKSDASADHNNIDTSADFNNIDAPADHNNSDAPADHNNSDAPADHNNSDALADHNNIDASADFNNSDAPADHNNCDASSDANKSDASVDEIVSNRNSYLNPYQPIIENMSPHEYNKLKDSETAIKSCLPFVDGVDVIETKHETTSSCRVLPSKMVPEYLEVVHVVDDQTDT